MSGRHLRALIEQEAPGRTIRELEAAAGVPENKLGYWTKPGTQVTRMPTKDQIREVARIIGCETAKVYRAFRLTVDGDAELDLGLADDERALLATYRQLTLVEQRKLIQIAHVLHGTP